MDSRYNHLITVKLFEKWFCCPSPLKLTPIFQKALHLLLIHTEKKQKSDIYEKGSLIIQIGILEDMTKENIIQYLIDDNWVHKGFFIRDKKNKDEIL